MATQKERFADRVLEMNEHLVALLDELPELYGTYFDKTWNSGAADAIIDGDVSSRTITASGIGNFITMVAQLNNFFQNSTVTEGDYAATINALRHGGS